MSNSFPAGLPRAQGLLLAASLLLSSCNGTPADSAKTAAAPAPANMMAPLHAMESVKKYGAVTVTNLLTTVGGTCAY